MNFYDIKPQVAKPEHGPEPSIMELLRYYYTSHGIDVRSAIRLSALYIQQLEIDRRKPLEMFISGPNGYAMVVPISNLERWEKRYGEELVIEGLCALTGDDEEDYTVTMLNKGASNV